MTLLTLRPLGFVLAGLLAFDAFAAAAPTEPDKPRLLVLTDFFKDPDDKQSLIRLLVYANEFDIEGLIATSLAYGDGQVHPEWIHEVIDDYAKVVANLCLHQRPGYEFPLPEALKAVVRRGAPVIRTWVGTGKGFPVPHPAAARDSRTCDPPEKWIGAGRDTEASEHIIRVIDRNDPRPVWIVVWGGPMDLGQALWKVRHTRTPEAAARFVARIRLCQDSWQDTGAVWIWENFSNLFLIHGTSLYAGLFKEGPPSLHNEAWLRAHVLEGHGPLGASYPPANAHGKVAVNIKEGDSWTFFHLLAPGLTDPLQPGWGGWGGRFQRYDDKTRFYVDGHDRHPTSEEPLRQKMWTLGRWNEARANEFAARMDWCVRPFAQANHPPIVRLENDISRRVLQRQVSSGEKLRLSAVGSTDPDGHALTYRWWHYREPGTFSGELKLSAPDTREVSFVAPPVAQPESIHLILEVVDSGEPRLTSYRRAVVTVAPAP